MKVIIHDLGSETLPGLLRLLDKTSRSLSNERQSAEGLPADRPGG